MRAKQLILTGTGFMAGGVIVGTPAILFWTIFGPASAGSIDQKLGVFVVMSVLMTAVLLLLLAGTVTLVTGFIRLSHEAASSPPRNAG